MKTTFTLLALLITSACVLFASAAGKEFNDADAELNSTYQAVLTSLAGTRERAAFIQAQSAWIKSKDADVTFFSARYPESKGGLFFLIHLTRERTEYLKSLLATPPSNDPSGGAVVPEQQTELQSD
jgi:uncharacterized protein YecT (DUF1311 family)